MKKLVSLFLAITMCLSLCAVNVSASSAYKNVTLPATIEGENFDKGAAGSYSGDGVNTGGIYRISDPIDIMPTTCGHRIILLEGDWTRYTFNVKQEGAYLIRINGSGKGELYVNDIATALSFDTDATEVVDVAAIWFTAGTHSIKIKSTESLIVDYIEFFVTKKDSITLDELTSYTPPKDPEYDEDAVYMDIYVSPSGSDSGDGSASKPFATIGKAKAAAAAASSKMTGNIIVHMLPGYYQLDEAEVFDESVSGKNGYNIIFKGESATEPTIISGGTKIEDWELSDDGYTWKAPAPVEDTRTLYINGYPAQRAVSKYLYTVTDNFEGEYNASMANSQIGLSRGFKTSSTNIMYDFQHPEELEVVASAYWAHRRVPVKDVYLDPTDSTKVVFEMQQEAWDRHRGNGGHVDIRLINHETVNTTNNTFYLENALELLDEPGEFYFDKTNKEIYYYPYAQENLETAETYVGTTEMMIKVEGSDSANKVSNLIFENLEFRYGAWNGLTTDGLAQDQVDEIAVGNSVENNNEEHAPSQFTVNFAKNIKILDCKFIALGSGAIAMKDGVHDSVIKGNVIRDVSGTGICIDHSKHKNILPDGCERCDNIEIANNVIHRSANELRGMTGITMMLGSNITIRNNDIKGVPYTGISMGWGWGAINSLATVNNEILNNKIEDVTSISTDGAHIYTLDMLNNARIAGNYLIESGDYRGGVYLDEGSKGITIEGNMMDITGTAGGHNKCWLFAREGAKLENNTATGNYYTSEGESVGGMTTATNNSKVRKSGSNWLTGWITNVSTAVNAIINNAGLEAAYSSLLEGTDLPTWRTDVLDTQPMVVFSGDADSYDEGFVAAQASTFSDISGHWAEEEITTLANDGVINGVSETEFAPEETLSLYQAVWLVSRCIGIEYSGDECWKDVAEQNGFMDSEEEDRAITREEFAHIVMNGYKIKKGDAVEKAELTFNDTALISAEYVTSVAQAVTMGFVQGDENGNFNPQGELTRAEGATIVARLQSAIE